MRPPAGAFATALVEAYEELQVTIVGLPSELAELRKLYGEHGRIAYAVGNLVTRLPQPVDAVLFTEALLSLPDADAVQLLAEAKASLLPGGRVLVFTEVLDPELANDHDYESDLLEFALNGGGVRDEAEYAGLFSAAGLTNSERATVGWGFSLYQLTG